MVAPGVFLTSPPGSRDMLSDVSQSNSANKNENELLLGFFVCTFHVKTFDIASVYSAFKVFMFH